jgi:hypothetical protein
VLAALAMPALADDRPPPEAPPPEAPIDALVEPPAPIVQPQTPTMAPAPVAPPRGPFANAPVTELVAIAPAPRGYRGAVSLQLATLDATGLAIQVERASQTRKKLSAAIAVGARSAAQGDYASTTIGAGVELRRWLRRPQGMTGWYVGARTDLARTSLEDRMEDRAIGALTTWTTGISTGYRWVLFRKVEITPSIGLAMVVEGGMDGKSPATVRGGAVLGLTAGWIY